MIYYIILHYIISYYIILTLYYIILYYIILYYIVLYDKETYAAPPVAASFGADEPSWLEASDDNAAYIYIYINTSISSLLLQ